MLALPTTRYECNDSDGGKSFHSNNNERQKVRRRGTAVLSPIRTTSNRRHDETKRESKRHAVSCLQTMDRILSGLVRQLCRLCILISPGVSFDRSWQLVSTTPRWIRVLGLATAVGSIATMVLKRLTTRNQARSRRIEAAESQFHILFRDETTGRFSTRRNMTQRTNAVRLPPKLIRPIPKNLFFNGLYIASLVSNETESQHRRQLFQRMIPSDSYDIAEHHRHSVLASGNDGTIPYQYWYEEDVEGLHVFSCRMVSWVKFQFLNCNTFHELSIERNYPDRRDTSKELQQYDSYLVNHGFYRDIWVNQQPAMKTTSILKTTRYQFDFGWRNLFDVHREALIMERLTKFSNIVSSYGHCGTSVLTEALPREVEQYIVPGKGYYHLNATQQKLDNSVVPLLLPQNDLTASEKLETALAMAESIAVLHGYVDGVIVHDDIQLQQWLRDSDGMFKLGDFNRATILAWNEKEQRYCKFSNGETFGNYRAPEEFDASDLDEKIDVFSFANNIYCLLTGLWPFNENEDDSVVQGMVSAGVRALVPVSQNQYYGNISWALIDVMQRGWIHNPDERIDIFETVQLLRAAIRSFGGGGGEPTL